RTTHPVLDALGDLRSGGSSVGLAGFVLSMVETRDEVCLQVAQEAWSTLPSDLVLEAFVPRDPAFLRASAAGVPVGLLSKRPPPVAFVFDHIAAELEPRLGLPLEDHKDDAPIPLLD
ncbi:MAG: ParA family protein, partial [Thermoanaerobaculia bacterium]